MTATKRVGGTVACLTASRDVRTVNDQRVDFFKVEWKNPEYLFDQNRDDYATWLDSNIDFYRNNCQIESCQVWAHAGDLPPGGGMLLEETRFDFYWVKGIAQETSYEKPFDRNRFHPVREGCTCQLVQVKVHGGNDSGEGGWNPDDRNASGRGPDMVFNYWFQQPPAPAVEWTGLVDEENYHLGYGVDCRPGKEDDDKTPAEVYDTVLAIYRQDNIAGTGYANRRAVLNRTVAYQGADVAGDVETLANLRSLKFNEWVEYTLDAYNRGMWGDGPHHTASYVFSWPARARVAGIDVSSLSLTTGVITVRAEVPSNAHRWTTKAKLQRLRNVDPSLTADDLNSESYPWEDVTGMVNISERYRDTSWSTGFVDSVAAAAPTSGSKVFAPNLRTWYRVVTENEVFHGSDNQVRSRPFECRQLYREQTAADDKVFVESIETNEDATAIKVLLGWTNSVDSTGIEVSWSSHEDAWESSEQPSTANVTWEDPTNQGTHDKSAHFTIYGVEQGEPVYVKARWYLEDDDGKVVDYGPYATVQSEVMFPYVPAMPPADVRLTAPKYVRRGDDVPLTWTFQSDAPQTAWVVYRVALNSQGVETSREPVISGQDAYGACAIPAGMLSGDEVSLVVSITTGSAWADSEPEAVKFADTPTVDAALPSSSAEDELPVILAQPVAVYCSSDTGDDYLRVRVVSHGITVSEPDGETRQLPGDVVFDAYVAPEWAMGSDGLYYTCVVLPDDLQIYDVGIYDFEVTAVNQTTGLQSDTQVSTGRVRWAHQAHQPGSGSTVTAYPSDRVCVIEPAAPDNAEDTDVFDLYRVTPDGAFLIAEGMRFGSAVSDRYAPFGRGDLMYRICTRTTDGDISWRDVPYEMKCNNLRLDWGEESLELPYNLVRNESMAKDFERRPHLDGNVGGGWNPAVEHDGTVSTDMVRFESAGDQRLIRSLAYHAGPVFVRLPNGLASQANVDVSGLDESYQSGAIQASLTCNFVSLTEEFMVSSSEVSYAEPPEDQTVWGKPRIARWNDTCPQPGDTFEVSSQTVRFKLSTGYDDYTNEWTLDATVSGTTATLGAFSAELLAYLSDVPAGSLYLLTVQEAQDA